MSVKQISVFLENRPGALCEMTRVLGDNAIDMRAFSLAETSDFGIARIIVDDVYKTTTVLRDKGFVHSVTPVLAAALSDTPGGLNEILQCLSAEGINVEYMYGFSLATGKQSVQIFRLNDPDHAIDILNKAHICVLGSGELFGN